MPERAHRAIWRYLAYVRPYRWLVAAMVLSGIGNVLTDAASVLSADGYYRYLFEQQFGPLQELLSDGAGGYVPSSQARRGQT